MFLSAVYERFEHCFQCLSSLFHPMSVRKLKLFFLGTGFVICTTCSTASLCYNLAQPLVVIKHLAVAGLYKFDRLFRLKFFLWPTPVLTNTDCRLVLFTFPLLPWRRCCLYRCSIHCVPFSRYKTLLTDHAGTIVFSMLRPHPLFLFHHVLNLEFCLCCASCSKLDCFLSLMFHSTGVLNGDAEMCYWVSDMFPSGISSFTFCICLRRHVGYVCRCCGWHCCSSCTAT